MGPFGVLSIIGSIWPRVVAVALIGGFVFFPHDADAALMWAAHVEAGHIASVFRHALESMGRHACHARAAGCRR